MANSCQSLLFLAIYFDAPLDIIRTLLELRPELSLIADARGFLPIHIVCYKGLGWEYVQLLVDHDHGASVRALTASGNSPLHFLVEHLCDPMSFLKLSNLMAEEVSGSSAGASTSDGDVLMRSLSGSRLSQDSEKSMNQTDLSKCIESLEVLCAVAPEMTRCTNKKGQTPIDILQDVKFENLANTARWERADIAYRKLRKVSIQLYLDQKKLFELSFQKSGMGVGACNSSLPSLQSSNASSISSFSLFDPSSISLDTSNELK